MIGSVIDHLEIFVRHYMPNGKAWNAKNTIGSGIRNLANGFTDEFARGDLTINNFIQEMMPDTTDEYIGRWERAVGIPDACFVVASTLADRRLNVQRKLSLLGLQTRSDFEGFASSLGITITARSGVDHLNTADGGYETYLPTLDVTTDFANIKEARQTLVIATITDSLSFTYDFDFPFSSPEEILMQCVFRIAKASNTNILFTLLP